MHIRYIALETWRVVRNVRSLVFSLALPVVMLLIFGSAYGGAGVDPVTHLPWLVLTTVQMAAYGAMGGVLGLANVIVAERSTGWNRQLRLTPLSGAGYLASKLSAALVIAAVAITVSIGVSVVVLHTVRTPGQWLAAGVAVWLGVIPFALIAVLIGLFARPEFAQPLFLVVFFGLSILGGLWVPLSVLPTWVTDVAEAVPSYWLNRIGQEAASGALDLGQPVLVLAAWALVVGAVITWRYRRDAARA